MCNIRGFFFFFFLQDCYQKCQSGLTLPRSEHSLDTANNSKYVLMAISNEMRSGMKSHSEFIVAPAVGNGGIKGTI